MGVQGEKIRILVAKPGIDIHDRGGLVLTQAFRDAGIEAIYTGSVSITGDDRLSSNTGGRQRHCCELVRRATHVYLQGDHGRA